MTKKAKAKAVPYRFIEQESDEGKPIYVRLARIVDAHHEDLKQARIALVWQTNWKTDVDGRITLAATRKVGDLERELRGEYNAFDFVILLNKKWWTDPLTTSAHRDAILDHSLCHARPKFDQSGEPEVDERDRNVYRLREEDVIEFSEIIRRHGTYTRNLELAASALDRVRQDSKYFVGVKTVQERLVAVGVPVPYDSVVAWSVEERNDADVFARLVLELRKHGLDEPEPPAHVAAALRQPADSEGPLLSATAH